MENSRREKKLRARARVAQLKGFYIHLTVYIVINLFIIATSVVDHLGKGGNLWDASFNFGTFSTAIFWGIGIGFHAIKTFGYNPFFSKEWEERQIQKFMEEDRKDAEKFRKLN